MKYLGYSELTKRLYILPASAREPKVDITDDVKEYMMFVKPDTSSVLEQNRKSYNKGFLDSKKEQVMDFIKWIGEQDLKRYAEGWCQPGGSNGFYYSDEDLYQLFEDVKSGSR